MRFDNTPPKYYYQFIDPQLLKSRLFESIWYLHSQPPIFNFLTGLLYQRFSPQSKIYALLFLVLGFIFSFLLYWLGLRLGLKAWVSALLSIWFMVSPATVLYENLYFYSYPTAFLLMLAALTLSKFLETDHFGWGLAFCSCLAALCLMWAIFHFFWMIAVLLLLAVFYRNWRKLILISALPVLLVFGWYTKNYFLFGSFSASSWVGMNLSHVTFLSPLMPPSVRESLIGLGELNPYPVKEAFRPIKDYDGILPIPPASGIPVLDENVKSTEAINFNHAFYIPLSTMMLQDAIHFVRIRPDIYLQSVKQGFLIYFHSSSDYLLLKDKPTPGLEHWWDRIFYGQISSYNGDFNQRWETNPSYVGWFLVIVYIAAAIYGVRFVAVQGRTDLVLSSVLAFMTLTILYFTFMANFFDLGENNRFRFTIDPLVFMLFVLFLQDFILKQRERTNYKVERQ